MFVAEALTGLLGSMALYGGLFFLPWYSRDRFDLFSNLLSAFNVLRVYAMWNNSWRIASLVAVIGFGIPVCTGQVRYPWTSSKTVYQTS